MAVALPLTIEDLLALQRDQDLFITKLSEPILAQTDFARSQNGARSSDVSSAAEGEVVTVESLQADLEHYKELFTKLRFSYVEQTTKEKFLRAILDPSHPTVTAAENAELEAQLAIVKAALKAQKTEVDALVKRLEEQSRELVRRQASVNENTERLVAMPVEIERLREERDSLALEMEEMEGVVDNMGMSLEELEALIHERQREGEELDEQVREAEEELQRKEEELRRLQEELGPLQEEAERLESDEGAQDGRGGGPGFNEEMEKEGRWLKGVQATMRALLETES